LRCDEIRLRATARRSDRLRRAPRRFHGRAGREHPFAIACVPPPDARTPVRTIADRSRMVAKGFRMVAKGFRMVTREHRMVARQLRRALGGSARSHRAADARLPIPGGHKPVRMGDWRSRTVARRRQTRRAASGWFSHDFGKSRRHSYRSLAGWDGRLALSAPRDPVSDRQSPGRTDASAVRSEAGSRR